MHSSELDSEPEIISPRYVEMLEKAIVDKDKLINVLESALQDKEKLIRKLENK